MLTSLSLTPCYLSGKIKKTVMHGSVVLFEGQITQSSSGMTLSVKLGLKRDLYLINLFCKCSFTNEHESRPSSNFES